MTYTRQDLLLVILYYILTLFIQISAYYNITNTDNNYQQVTKAHVSGSSVNTSSLNHDGMSESY